MITLRNVIVCVLVIAAFRCKTTVKKTTVQQPKGVRLHGFDDKCTGRVYMKTFVVDDFSCRSSCDGCYREQQALDAAAKYANGKRVLAQKNIYWDKSILKFVEIVVCEKTAR